MLHYKDAIMVEINISAHATLETIQVEDSITIVKYAQVTTTREHKAIAY